MITKHNASRCRYLQDFEKDLENFDIKDNAHLDKKLNKI